MKTSLKSMIVFCMITLWIEGCTSINKPPIELSGSDKAIARALVNKYQQYIDAFNRVREMNSTGEAVKILYLTSQTIIDDVINISVPNYLYECKFNLITGIKRQSQGLGCYSNKTLCNGDLEATALLAKGLVNLNNFRNEIFNFID